MKQVLCLLICLVMASDASIAQQLQLKRYSIRDGLSSNAVSAMIKDSAGFMWLATSNGLNRFDGNSFDHFVNNPADSGSIASNDIHNLYIDRQQRLWVTTLGGLSLYHPKAQTFSNYAPDSNVLPKIGSLYPAIAQDDSGHIWLGGWYDLLIFDEPTGRFRSSGWAQYASRVKPSNGNHSRVVVLGLKVKSRQELWVLTSYGLFSVHTVTKQFQYYPNPIIQDYYGCQLNYVDQKGCVWLGTYQNGILRYDPRQAKWSHFAMPVINLQGKGWYWAYGIAPLHGDTMLYCSLQNPMYLVARGSSYEPVAAPVFQQAGGGYTQWLKDGKYYWFISGNGLARLSPAVRIFNKVQPPRLVNTTRLFPIQATTELLAGDAVQKKIYRYNYAVGSLAAVGAKGTLVSYAGLNDTTALLCTEEGIYRYHPLLNRCTAIKAPPKQHDNNPTLFRNIVQNNKGVCWIRDRRQGIIEYNSQNQQCRYLPVCATDEQTTFCSLFFDSSSNRLWVGVENKGLYIYDLASGTSAHYLFNIAPSQKGATFNGFAPGNNGVIYAAELSYGLFEISRATMQYKRYTVQDGLASNSCNYCCRDAAGNIWVSNLEGISRLDAGNKTFMNFSELKAEANFAGFIQADAAGNIWMPADSGYVQWNVHDFSVNRTTGNIYLRRALQGATAIPIDSLYHFTHAQNNLSFLFGYHAYDQDGSPTFQYQLNQSEWADFTAEQGLVFSNLSPNNYTLKVRMKNTAAVPLVIRFVVAPPFYRTGWFMLLLCIGLVGIVAGLFTKRIAAVRKEAALKQQVAQTETMALRAQMNPHFIFNCINSIDNFILGNERENASNYLNKFARLIRNILDNSREAVVPFWKDWETLQLYVELEHLRSNDKFTYTMHADDELLNGHYKIPPLIIQPYVENAIGHGLNALTDRVGKLIITARLNNQVLEYEVYDNGVGRSFTGKQQVFTHQSYGMQMTGERIKLFNNEVAPAVELQDLQSADGQPAGTCIKVRLAI